MIMMEVAQNTILKEIEDINLEKGDKVMGEKKVKEYFCSADIGKFNTKLIGREKGKDKDTDSKKDEIKKVCFRTKKYTMSEEFFEVEGNSFSVKFDGQEYVIGEQGVEIPHGTSKTELTHKLACYTAITRLLKPNTTENYIDMVLACPLSSLKSKVEKERYRNFIANENNLVNIIVNDEKFEFIIRDITIKAEGSGVLYIEANTFKDSDVAIVDLGGLNMGFSLYRNGSCKLEDRFIEECGTDMLIDLVRDYMSQYLGGNIISVDEASKVLHDNGLKKNGAIDPKSVEYLDKAKKKYFENVLNNIKNHKFDISKLDRIVFVGGTSNHLKAQINELPHALIPGESAWITVEGLYKIAYAKYGKK